MSSIKLCFPYLIKYLVIPPNRIEVKSGIKSSLAKGESDQYLIVNLYKFIFKNIFSLIQKIFLIIPTIFIKQNLLKDF